MVRVHLLGDTDFIYLAVFRENMDRLKSIRGTPRPDKEFWAKCTTQLLKSVLKLRAQVAGQGPGRAAAGGRDVGCDEFRSKLVSIAFTLLGCVGAI